MLDVMQKARNRNSPSRLVFLPPGRARIQRKLMVNTAGDAYEREPDRIADHITQAPSQIAQRSCACGGECSSCKKKEKVQTKRLPSSDTGAMEAPAPVSEVVESAGQALDSTARRSMEPQFGHDFSRVRVHVDARAADAARSIQARAYTVGQHIVFGRGEYLPATAAGQKLLAHELTHVVQQSHGAAPSRLQRQEFKGAPGTTAKNKDRPLKTFKGRLPEQKQPGGTVVQNTDDSGQNCAGDSCSLQKWIIWPYVGPETTVADWSKAIAFVPTGCTRVNCSGIDVHHTRCKTKELELIAFLYQWPAVVNGAAGIRSDFHMVGRKADSLPSGWHSKIDSREKVVDIRSPEQSLSDAYPHTKKQDRTIVKICLCCSQSAIKTG